MTISPAAQHAIAPGTVVADLKGWLASSEPRPVRAGNRTQPWYVGRGTRRVWKAKV